MKRRKQLASILAGILAGVMLLSMILSLLPTRANASSSSEIKQQINELKGMKEELEGQREALKEQFQENEDEIQNIINQKDLIDQEIFLLYGQIEIINQQLAAYALLIADKQDELDAASAHLEELNQKNKERIRAMEEDGALSYWSVLFKASSFADLLDRMDMIAEIAAADRRRLQEMHDAAEDVQAAREALEQEKDELETAREELAQTETALDEKRAEADAFINELLARGYELEELYAQYEAAEAELMAEIAEMEKEYTAVKHQEYLAYIATQQTTAPTQPTQGTQSTEPTEGTTTGGQGTTPTQPEQSSGNGDDYEEGVVETRPTDTGTGTTTGTTTGTGTAGSSTVWLLPCNYKLLTSPFGEREAPTAGASTNHLGVDLSAPEGTPVYASRAGTVTKATKNSAAGYYITINHGDGYSSMYLHLSRFAVSKGQTVSAGQLIGYVGNTGISTGPHLDFRIIYNGTYVNPAYYVNLY